MWACSPKKSVFFDINLPKKGIPPQVIFTNLAWGGSPGPHPRAKFHRCGFKNVGLQPKNHKKVIFGKNLLLRENSGSQQKKLKIGAQLQTFLYAVTP